MVGLMGVLAAWCVFGFSRLNRRCSNCNEQRWVVYVTLAAFRSNEQLTVLSEGRLDTTTAPLFEEELRSNLDDIEWLVLDMERLK